MSSNMPSTMIHLMCAYKIHNDYPIEYYIGTIAPDAIAVREQYIFTDKDKLHFRNSQSPMDDIIELASSIDMTNPYCEGYIIHLFLDTYWDNECVEPFKCKYAGSKWVTDYRIQISKASSYIYNNNPILHDIWTNMTDYRGRIDLDIQGITFDEIVQYYDRNAYWFEKYNTGESQIYRNSFVDKYTDKIAEEYKRWSKAFYHSDV